MQTSKRIKQQRTPTQALFSITLGTIIWQLHHSCSLGQHTCPLSKLGVQLSRHSYKVEDNSAHRHSLRFQDVSPQTVKLSGAFSAAVCLQCCRLLRFHVNGKKATKTNRHPINERGRTKNRCNCVWRSFVFAVKKCIKRNLGCCRGPNCWLPAICTKIVVGMARRRFGCLHFCCSCHQRGKLELCALGS